jgi:hypothetical protein
MLGMPAPPPARHDAPATGAQTPLTPAGRDAAVRRLTRYKRWLLAGTAALAGALTVVAADAFPGRSGNRATASPAGSPASTAPGQAAESQESQLRRPEQEPQVSAGAESAVPGVAAPEAPVVSGGS